MGPLSGLARGLFTTLSTPLNPPKLQVLKKKLKFFYKMPKLDLYANWGAQ